MEFYLYKGLKKPLVFFGLKDKYLYYGLGTAVAGLFGAIILGSMIGLFGNVIGLGLAGLGIWWIYKLQDTKGLYNKTKNNDELHFFPKRLEKRRIIRK